MDHIAVINATTILSDADVSAMMVAVQTQVSRDFTPNWGVDAHLVFVPHGTKPPIGYWWMAVLDDADAAGALGYHDITPDGMPLGKVFARTARTYGYSVSVTLSHETLEMLGDPDVNLLVEDARILRRFWAYEICDAVEDDSLGYAINGVLVSDFVLPSYFETFRRTGPFDFMKRLAGPVPALTPNGYMAYVQNGSWGQVFGRSASSPRDDRALWRARPHDGSRRRRRMTERDQRIRSVVEVVAPSLCAHER